MPEQRRNKRLTWSWGFAWVLVAAAGLMLTAGPAQTEPYMSVREGYKCSKCHVNKTGGGMRTDYAKVYLNSRLAAGPSLFGSADGAENDLSGWATGRMSPYFSVSADLRADLVYTHFDNTVARSEFMHASEGVACRDCHGIGADGQGGGKRAELYARMEVPNMASLVLSQSFAPTPGTKEVYALLESLPGNGYVKAGTFKLPTGLGNTFDEPFYHTNQGSGGSVPTLETVRGTGVEVGFEPGLFSVAVSLTNPHHHEIEAVPKTKRVHVSAYGVNDLGLVGVTLYRDPISSAESDPAQTEDEYSILQGVYGGVSLGRFTVMLEADALKTKLIDSETKQQVSLAQLDYLIARGHNVKLQYEAIDPDKDTEKDIRDRTTLVYEPFLTPYLQVRAGLRIYNGPTQADHTVADTNNGKQGFLELHLVY